MPWSRRESMAGLQDDTSRIARHHPGSPWVNGEHAAASRRSRHRASRAVVHHFTILVLAVALGVVVVAALPTVERVLSGDPAITARRGIARTLWAKGYAVGPPEADRPHPAQGGPAPAGDGRLRRPSRTHGEPGIAGLELFESLLDPEANPGDDAAAVGNGAWAARDIVLRRRAAVTSEPTATVSRGQLLVVVRQDGEWLLLAFKDGDQLGAGWARRDQVLLFP